MCIAPKYYLGATRGTTPPVASCSARLQSLFLLAFHLEEDSSFNRSCALFDSSETEMADNSTCLSGAPAFRLADNYICNPGFYCPNNSEEHPPEYCPPTSSCQSIRLQLQRNICPEAQGAFEPLICPPGSYCPPGGKAIHACPSKHFCPLGSAHPNRCGLTSICPAGSVREFRLIGFVLVIAIDIVLALMSWWLMRRLKKKSVACRVEEGKITPTSESKTTSQATEDDLREYISSVSRVTGGDGIGLSFTFSDMSYSIPNSNVKIISSMTGEIRKGRLCAVMGASGAGKSTFVDLLIGKKEPESGSRLVNNKPIDSSLYNKAVGYVPQDSSLLPELTVRETLLHSARVRLPRSWTNDELLHHLNLVQRLLKLNHVQHDLVGDHTNHTLSGGERKRVSIGIELSSSPMALILDEPTSGLDASSAFSVVTLLRQLAQMGVTIILIIHQPRKEIFDCIDDVILLEGGQAAYQGPRSRIQEYFQSLGFQFPPASNPADVIMDIISHRMQTQDGKYFSQTNRTLSDLGNLLERPSSDEEAHGTNDDAVAATHSWIKKSRLGASWLRQFWLCTLRSLKQQQRRASSFFLEIAVGGVAGLLIGLSLYSYQGLHFQGVYLAPFERLSTSVTNMTVAMIALMVCMAIGLTASPPGVKTFGEEKSIYWRERRSGHSISAYYVGKVVSTLPRILISALHFTSFYTILATPTMSFWESYCVNVVYFYAIYGLASCISILVRKENGPLIAVIVCLIVSVLGGHGPSLHTVKEWHLEWFWRMCPGTWASEAYIDKTFQRVGYLYDIHAAAESAGFTLGRYGLSVCMIIILGTAYRAAAFVAMLLWKDGL